MAVSYHSLSTQNRYLPKGSNLIGDSDSSLSGLIWATQCILGANTTIFDICFAGGRDTWVWVEITYFVCKVTLHDE